MEDGFNPADISLFNFEEFGELPSPVDLFMIEKAESEGNAAFAIHGHETAVPDSRHYVSQCTGLKLLLAFLR